MRHFSSRGHRLLPQDYNSGIRRCQGLRSTFRSWLACSSQLSTWCHFGPILSQPVEVMGAEQLSGFPSGSVMNLKHRPRSVLTAPA